MARSKLNLTVQVAAYEHFSEAIRAEVESHAVQITCLNGEEPVEGGSGVAVAIGDRRFVFTAAHVVRPYDRIANVFRPYGREELWLLPRAGGAMRDRLVPIACHCVGGGPNYPWDAAVIEIDRADADRLGTSFITPARFSDHWQAELGELVALNGFPVQHLEIRTRKTGAGDLIWTPATVITLLDDPATWTPEIDPLQEVQIHYPEKFDALVGPGKVDLPDVPAMSGGGFWACRLTKRDDVWIGAKAVLMGTIVSWHRKERWVSMARIGQHVRLVRSWYPDLEMKGLV